MNHAKVHGLPSVCAKGLLAMLALGWLSQGFPQTQWINYANQKWINALALDAGDLWIGSRCGLVREAFGTRRYHYDRANSDIPHNFINAIAIDKSGNKWIGTNGGGLARLSGTAWTVYDTANSVLPDDAVRCIGVHPDGDVWVGTDRGVVRISGATWTVYDTLNTPSLRGNRVTAIATGSMLVYVGTNRGVAYFRYDTQSWSFHTGSPINVTSLALEDELIVWVGTSYGLWRSESNTWADYTANLPSDARYVNALAYSSRYGLWAGSLFNGLFRFHNNAWVQYTTANVNLPSNSIQSLAVDDSVVWVGTSEDAARFNGAAWTIYRFSQYPIPSYCITAMVIDSLDNKWLGTDYKGICRYDGSTWRVFSIRDTAHPDDWVDNLFIDRTGGVWAATEMGGAGRYNGSAWAPIYTAATSPLPSDWVTGVAVDSAGTYWFSTDQGIAQLKGLVWTIINKTNTPALPANLVYALHCDSANCMWVGTIAGLACCRGSAWTTFSEPILKARVNCITSVGATVYVGTEKGVAMLRSGTAPALTAYYDTANSDLPSNDVHSILSDRIHGTYFGTAGGLARTGRPWTVLTPKNSHINNGIIYDIAFDKQNNMWLATSSGLEEYNANGIVGTQEPGFGADSESRAGGPHRFGVETHAGGVVIRAGRPVESVSCTDLRGRCVPVARQGMNAFFLPSRAPGIVVASVKTHAQRSCARLVVR